MLTKMPNLHGSTHPLIMQSSILETVLDSKIADTEQESLPTSM